MMFHVVLQPEEDGWIIAECPALPGCISQGKDEKEALANIKEAIVGWLGERTINQSTTFPQASICKS